MSNDFQIKLQAIVNKVVPEYRSQTQKDVELVLQTGANSYENWLALLENQNTNVEIRETICWVLGRLGEKTALPALLITLNDKNHRLRMSAASALGMLGDQEAIPPLLNLLNTEEDIEVRFLIVHALGFFSKNDLVVETLTNILINKTENPKIRGHAAESLAFNRDDSEIVNLMITALKDPSVEVRFWAAYALGQLGNKTAIPELERLAATDKAILPGWWEVSKEAADAINNLQE